MENVPIELWIDVLSKVPRADLVQVIQVGHRLLADVGRLLLYSSVHLRSDDSSVDLTLDLLSRRDDLARGLKSITLTTNARPERSVSRTFLSACNRICAFDPAGQQPEGTVGQEILGSTFHSPPALGLDSFADRSWHKVFPILPILTSVRQVEYQTDLGRLEYPILKMMGACRTNLTHIVFAGTLDLRDSTYFLFLSMTFPKLVSIEMGSLYRSNRADPTSEAITAFLVAHPLVQHLSLGRHRSTADTFQLHGPLVNASFLPKLQSFEGFPSNVELMAERRVASLQALTHLSLFIFPWEREGLQRMYDKVWEAFPHAQGLLCVGYLRAEFEVDLSHLMASNTTSLDFSRCSDILATLCPNVTYWYGRLPSMSDGHLATVFASYDHLQTINLPWQSLLTSMRGSEKTYFGRVSQRCAHLRQVVARKVEHTELEDLVYNIERHGGMDLQQVRVESVRRFEVPHI